jgi:transposase
MAGLVGVDGPTASRAKVSGLLNRNRRPPVVEFKRIAIDTSKSVFTLHGVDAQERPVLRRDLRRARMEPFFAKLPPTEVVLEACGGSHHWGRTLQAMGHRVRLIPPQYVKPFVKRAKNDRNDAEAISEAASRPTMRSVAIKSAEQQAQAMVLSVRELLVGQRTQLINAVRGHAAEFGVVAAKGTSQVTALLAAVAGNTAVPQAAREMLVLLGRQVDHLDREIARLDTKLMARHKAHPVSRLLAGIPGIGPIGALTLALRIDPAQFESGRHFSAWIGLTPREHSSGGKQRLGGISRAGDERLRQLLVLGATAVIQHAKPGRPGVSPWLLSLLERRPRKLAAVALANKMARIAWAMMTSGEAYRQGSPATA